jgi:bifunctional ADP-heptose synthase (sugar kinase/adenylyltransferase)
LSLAKIIEKFDDSKVLLSGDSIVDLYAYATAIGLAAETPTIAARQEKVQASLGGAALVCRNLLELGASVRFITWWATMRRHGTSGRSSTPGWS